MTECPGSVLVCPCADDVHSTMVDGGHRHPGSSLLLDAWMLPSAVLSFIWDHLRRHGFVCRCQGIHRSALLHTDFGVVGYCVSAFPLGGGIHCHVTLIQNSGGKLMCRG